MRRRLEAGRAETNPLRAEDTQSESVADEFGSILNELNMEVEENPPRQRGTLTRAGVSFEYARSVRRSTSEDICVMNMAMKLPGMIYWVYLESNAAGTKHKKFIIQAAEKARDERKEIVRIDASTDEDPDVAIRRFIDKHDPEGRVEEAIYAAVVADYKRRTGKEVPATIEKALPSKVEEVTPTIVPDVMQLHRDLIREFERETYEFHRRVLQIANKIARRLGLADDKQFIRRTARKLASRYDVNNADIVTLVGTDPHYRELVHEIRVRGYRVEDFLPDGIYIMTGRYNTLIHEGWDRDEAARIALNQWLYGIEYGQNPLLMAVPNPEEEI